jgi:hypothetical protein
VPSSSSPKYPRRTPGVFYAAHPNRRRVTRQVPGTREHLIIQPPRFVQKIDSIPANLNQSIALLTVCDPPGTGFGAANATIVSHYVCILALSVGIFCRNPGGGVQGFNMGQLTGTLQMNKQPMREI